jgi:alpha-mannosidase
MEADRMRFPVWNGELYLQYHRGTLTNVAKNKLNNRKSERLLRELEFLSAMAMRSGVPYPAEKLNEFWELVLINQFHDILPGTSIAEVYADSDAEYEGLFSTLASGNGPWHSAARALAPQGSSDLQLFNFTGHERRALVRIAAAPAGAALSAGGEALPLQQLHDADGSTAFAAPATVPALGWTAASLVAADAASQSTLSASVHHLENDLIRVTFDDNGEITSVFDKSRRRELIPEGQTANRLVAYEDKSLNWDAWDIDHYFEEQSWPLRDAAKIELVETGPYRAALRIERTYQSSRFVQVVSLEAGARQVEFDTCIDWVERQTVIKAEFPFDLNVSEIRSEIQFGHVKRPTHRNTSWDRARFEASMHRWVDMSEPDFGAALLNDCKYGYDAYEQLVRLTLVRGSTMPNPESDKGRHRLKYALFLHAGTSDLAAVPVAAERLNNPVAVAGTATLTAPATTQTFSFASVDAPNITLETVKKAEQSDALVLRLYEHANARATATIRFGVPVKSAQVVNLMEEAGEPVEVRDNAVTLNLRPFEIATLMLEI